MILYMYPIFKNIIILTHMIMIIKNTVNFTTFAKYSFVRQIPVLPQPKQKMICISPGGFKGFYLMGIISYIKEHYNLNDYVFSGASAGAWNAVLFTYKGDLKKLIHKVIGDKPYIYKNESIRDFELLIKRRILENSRTADYDLSSVYIGVTIFKNPFSNPTPDTPNKNGIISITNSKLCLTTSVYSNFRDLEDALDCCIASSHIPFVTGNLLNMYKNRYVFDGGVFPNPYYNMLESSLQITPNMWEAPISKNKWFTIEDYTTLFSKEKYNFYELFNDGYKDTKNNYKKLDKIFITKKP